MSDMTICKRCGGVCTRFADAKGDVIWECSQCGDQVKFIVEDNVIKSAKHLHDNAPAMVEFPSGDRDYLD